MQTAYLTERQLHACESDTGYHFQSGCTCFEAEIAKWQNLTDFRLQILPMLHVNAHYQIFRRRSALPFFPPVS